MTALASEQTKTCNTCGADKPVSEFYLHDNGRGSMFRASDCKDCSNSRERKATPARVINRRARQRATALLLEKHPEEFAELLARERRVAAAEYALLGEETILKPGPRREGQDVLERIDVARCRRCHTNHDRGHTCPSCGATEEEA